MSGLIGSTKLDPRVQTVASTAVEAPADNSFQQGMRQGITSAGGSLRALAGGVGEALGADEFAKAQYAKAAAAEQLAATQAPEVSRWQDVTEAPDFSTGMRRAGSYVAGLAGGAAPFIAAGAGAAALTGGGAVPALLAGTAAVAPVEIGAALQRQQHDPAALANNGAGMRLGTAALEGTMRAGAMMAVPQIMGGRMLGRIETGAAKSMPAAVGTNLAEGVAGNAVAGAAAEKISTTAEDVLNPNRDTSGDNARMIDAAVSGGALGVPFAGMGIAGHALHGKKPAPRTDGIALDGAAADPLQTAPVPKPSLQDRVKSLFAKGDNTIEQVAAGKDVIDVEALRSAAPEQQSEMLRVADGDRMAKAQQWADELLAGDKLSPENRAALAEQAKDLSSRANQTFVAGLKMATDTGSKVLNAATEFYDALTKKDDGTGGAAPAKVEGIKLSSIGSGAEKVIGESIAPHLDAKYPDLMKNDLGRKAVTGTMRRVMDTMQKTGELDHDTAEHLHSWFGDDTPAVLADLHDKVMARGDGPATERYFNAINKMTDSMGEHGKLVDKVKAALLPELQADATPESLKAAVNLMREYAAGEHLKDLTPAQAAFRSRQVEDGMRAHFGDKTNKLIGEFMKDAKAKEAARNEMLDTTSAVTDKAKLDEGGFEDTPETGVARETDKIYFGGGKDKAAPTFVLSERAHGAQFGGEGQAARLLRQARAEHPDMNVMTVPAEIYAREHGWGKQQLMDATNGKPKDHVMVVAEGIKREGLTWQDVEAVKNDSHNYPDSPSRIHTDAGVTLDAVKVLNMYAQEHKLARNETDALSPAHRMARQFKEAIGALSDHLGESIDVPPETVVARRGGKAVTWGELQKQSRVPDADPVKTALYKSREEAVKAGDAESVKAVDDKLSAEVAKEQVTSDERDQAAQGRIAKFARALGIVKEKAAAEAEKRGPLRDAAGKQLRPMSFVERGLAREYRDIEGGYNAEVERRGMGGELHSKDAGFDAAGKRVATESSAARKAGNGEGDFQSYMNMEGASWGGKAEIGPTDQIHLAQAANKGKGPLYPEAKDWATNDAGKLPGAFKASESMEAGREGNMLHADNFAPDTHFDGRLSRDIVSAISTKINRLENWKTAAARNVGTKARALFALVESGQMRMQDQAELASIVKDSKLLSVAETVNALHAKYKDVVAQPKKPSAFVERVLAGGEGDKAATNKLVAAIKKETDPKALQRVVDALGEHYFKGEHVWRVADAATERITALIEKDPTVAYSMQRAASATAADVVMQSDIRAHIDKVLGKTVDVEFAKMLHAGEFVRDPARVPAGMAQDVLRVSVHSLDPMGTAFHESLHAFLAKLGDDGIADKANPLFKAADSAHVRGQLHRLLAGEPDALKQVEASSEERAAYMYQFWERGLLNVAGKPKGMLEKVAGFFKRMLGMWTNDQRAEHIMEYFGSGEYAKNMGDRNAVARVLDANSTPTLGLQRRYAEFKQMVGPLDTLAARVIMTGDAQVRSIKNAALNEMLDRVYSPMQGAHDDVGYVPAARAKRTQVLNDLSEALAPYRPEVVTDALRAMQRGEKGATPEERLVVREVRGTLDAMYEYMKSNGVAVADLGYGKDYFPRVWDSNKILANEPAFRAMMDRYVATGEFKGNVDQVIATLTRTDGSDLQVETAKPGMQHVRERVLAFIKGRDAEPFLNENLYQTLNSYVSQGTRRAEWAARFGDDGAGLKATFEKARKQGATNEHIETATRYLKGLDGTLGDHIDPKLRRAFGNAIVYQNIRLLPLALFSSLIDPGGVLIRGGTVGEAWNTMKRGLAEIPKGFKKGAAHDDATVLAAQLGVIDSAVLRHALGSSYSQGMTSDLGRRVNDTFFKYNLMEQFNTSMRVGASEAAIGFLGRHADGKNSMHSPRWLAELGFKPGEIKLGADGRPLLHAHEFEATGMAPDKAQAAADRMTLAVNKWVDGAILRPNAAHKPLWMSDPHFALISHLKQFVYSFQETILKRVVNEAKHGNMGPAYSIAAYVPFMLAADMAKGIIVGGGSQPSARQNWDAQDWAWYEMQRAGLFGVGQFGIDVAKDIHRGGLGIGALTGPTIEQLGHAVSTVGGTEQFKTFALNALPANQLLDAAGEAVSTNVR